MAEIDPLRSGYVTMRTGKTASARLLPKKDGEPTEQLEVTVIPGKTTAKDIERMLSKLKIEYLSPNEIDKAVGANGLIEESELKGLDDTLEKSMLSSDLHDAGIDVDDWIASLTPEKAHNKQYIKTLKEFAAMGVKFNWAFFSQLTLEKGIDPNYIQIVKDLNKDNEFLGQFLWALTMEKAADPHYIALLKELAKEGETINAELIEHLTQEKASDTDYRNALIRMRKEGIQIDFILIQYLSQENARNPVYLSTLIGLHKIGVNINLQLLMILHPELIGSLYGRDARYIRHIIRDPNYTSTLCSLIEKGVSTKSLNIDYPERFVEDLPEIIENRVDVNKRDARPVALLIYPKTDWSMSFLHNQIRELIKRGYRVIYYEASKDTELINAVREVGVSQKISLLVIGGHGLQRQTDFSDADPGSNGEGANECHYLDIEDAQKLIGLSKYMGKGSKVILESCSTGEGGKYANNVANLIKKAFPDSMVFAPKVPSSVESYMYDANNRVIGINYDCGRERTYSIK